MTTKELQYKFMVKNSSGCVIAIVRDEDELDEYYQNGLIKESDKVIELNEEIYSLSVFLEQIVNKERVMEDL